MSCIMTGLIQESKMSQPSYFARINLTEAVGYDQGKMSAIENKKNLRLIDKDVVVEDADETHTFLYSYITRDQYLKLERQEETGYWICPDTGLAGTLEMADDYLVKKEYA